MQNILNKKRKKKGFTLIELIIVLAVIAIIAAIAIPNFTKVRTDSKLKADTQSAETIKRITLTLLAEDKVLPGDKITVTAGTAAKGDVFTGSITTEELTSSFKEVKKPQQDGETSYAVTITTGGNVEVKVGNVDIK